MLRLRRTRLLREWSQKQVAKRADIPQSQLSNIETGRLNPTPEELKRLGKVLGCPPARLMDHVVDPPYEVTRGRDNE